MTISYIPIASTKKVKSSFLIPSIREMLEHEKVFIEAERKLLRKHQINSQQKSSERGRSGHTYTPQP